MTLELSNSPDKPEIKTWFDSPPNVHIQGNSSHIEITMDDFCSAVYYAITNTPLCGDNDPRLRLIKTLSSLERKGDKFYLDGVECWSLVYPKLSEV